jgi:hypothetical protein
MRFACFLALGLVAMGCGESSAGGDLFAPSGTQATSSSTTSGSPTGSSSTTAGGTDATGSGGAPAGTSTTAGTAGNGGDAGATGVGGSSGAGGNGGDMGAGGDVIGSGGGGASGGMGGAGNGGAAGSAMGGASGSAGAAGAGGGSVDAGTPDHPIHCGTTVCAAQKEFCCIPEGLAARCVTLGGVCSDTADRVYCDDRSDCTGAGDVCCAADNLSGGRSTAACVPVTQCAAPQRKAQQLCDTQQPNQCVGIGMVNPCRLDMSATIPGYAYCH